MTTSPHPGTNRHNASRTRGAVLALLFMLATTAFAQTRIDIMVVYTAEARDAAGGAAGIISRIDAAMTQANQSLANSDAQTVLRLVHAAEVNYTETGNLGTELGRLRTTNDGHMDNVHALRDLYGADLVALLTGRQDTGGYAGVAYLMAPPSPGFAPWAFSVTRQDQALFHTFIHEIGHNMGSHHDPENKGGIDGAYPYSYGHRFMAGGTQYRTVMAYAPGTRVSHFSNPDISYGGTATGIANERDNARSIRDTRGIVAAFRPEAAPSPMQFRALALTNSVFLRWSAPTDSGLPTDLVQLRYDTTTYPANSASGTDIYQGSAQAFEHTGLTPGQTYYYSIFVTTDDGNTFIDPP